MSNDDVKPETDKKPEKASEIPDSALDKATGGLVREKALEENIGVDQSLIINQRVP